MAVELAFSMTHNLRQIAKFAFVGVMATAVHYVSAIAFNSLGQVPPLRANFLAFLVAFIVSYVGNWYWTFNKNSQHTAALPRFLGVAVSCFLVNQAIVYVFVEWLRQPLWLAMVPALLTVPALGFWLSKTRVFLPRSVP